jgi:hypothetical protein
MLSSSSSVSPAQAPTPYVKDLVEEGVYVAFTSSVDPKGEFNAQTTIGVALGAVGLDTVMSTDEILIAKATTSPIDVEVYILKADEHSQQILAMQSNVSTLLHRAGCKIHETSVADLHLLRRKHVISLLEAETPYLESMDGTAYEQVKVLLSTASHVLWLTRGGQTIDIGNVEFAPTTGFLRVVRNEYPGLTIPHLDLSSGSSIDDMAIADLVVGVWTSSISLEGSQTEMEYAESGGRIYISRLRKCSSLDAELQFIPPRQEQDQSWVR